MELNQTIESSNIISLPKSDTTKNVENIPTPKSDLIISKLSELSKTSAYKSTFNPKPYLELERRFHDKEFRGGIVFGNPMKLVNSHSTCQQCLYSLEIDTYGRGCVHDCLYCYARDQLTRHGYWNNPMPAPADISEIWKIFYTVFETDKHSKWRDILSQRIPIRIGSMSDSFMMMDKKYKITLELLNLLKFYDYPYIIFTRSDLVANDEYINAMDPELCSVQMSLSSTNDELNKLIEPGTPSAKRRLLALQKLSRNGFWTTVRLNPFFPMKPDGYYSSPEFPKEKRDLEFKFSSFDMVNEIADYGIPSILAGFVRLSQHAVREIYTKTGTNLKDFFDPKINSNSNDLHYSEAEIRAYYERLQARCMHNGIQFTTCYIGNGESMFWSDQDLWSNKKDCCNVAGKVKSFKNSARDISWENRIKHTNYKQTVPNDPSKLHIPLA